MRSELIFHITSAAGLQLRVVQRLKQIGIVTIGRTLKENPEDGNRYLVLKITGSDASDEQIWKQVSEIPGILSLVSEQPISDQASSTPSPQSEGEQEIEPEAGDSTIRDRMLIFSLLSRYPKIDGRFNEIITGIPMESREQRAYDLGWGFGLYLARQVKPKHSINGLADALTYQVIPALAPMASLQMQGTDLQIGSNHIDLKGREHSKNVCTFLNGTIKGLLRGHNMDELLISNQCCAEHGGTACRFNFQV